MERTAKITNESVCSVHLCTLVNMRTSSHGQMLITSRVCVVTPSPAAAAMTKQD